MHRTAALSLAVTLALAAGCTAVGTGAGGDPIRGAGGDAGPPPPPPPPGGGVEPCNGLDDDGDGDVDEGCTCADGDTQPCWPGAPAMRGAPGCTDGVQACVVSFEFAEWGACMGFTLCGEECDASTETSCDNGADDDCDGLVDCADPDCDGHEACGECIEAERSDFTVAPICKDGEDNDCDGLLDCDDPDCIVPGRTETVCDDGFDDDCDGMIDCDDPDCFGECPGDDCDADCIVGEERFCDTPLFCAWGKQVCNPGGTWGFCIETLDRPGSCDSFFYDRDCCVAAGACCQNFPIDDTSVGTCDDIVPEC